MPCILVADTQCSIVFRFGVDENSEENVLPHEFNGNVKYAYIATIGSNRKCAECVAECWDHKCIWQTNGGSVTVCVCVCLWTEQITAAATTTWRRNARGAINIAFCILDKVWDLCDFSFYVRLFSCLLRPKMSEWIEKMNEKSMRSGLVLSSPMQHNTLHTAACSTMTNCGHRNIFIFAKKTFSSIDSHFTDFIGSTLFDWHFNADNNDCSVWDYWELAIVSCLYIIFHCQMH